MIIRTHQVEYLAIFHAASESAGDRCAQTVCSSARNMDTCGDFLPREMAPEARAGHAVMYIAGDLLAPDPEECALGKEEG